MIRIIQSSWFTALIGGVIYLAVTFALLSPHHFEGALAARQAEEKPRSANDAPSWRFKNPEMEQWLAEIKREKEELALREQQLQELAARLEAERKELNSVTQLVNQLQMEFDRNVIRIKDQEIENIKRQAKVFSNMSPEAASALLSEMPEDDAARVLFVMKNDDVSTILETLSKMGKIESKRAATLTEKLRHILPPEQQTRARTF